MSHLILHVLSEAQLVRGYTNLCKEEVDSTNEVTKNGVIDHALKESKAGREKKTKTTHTDVNSQGSKARIYHNMVRML